jgi:MFS family permease
MADMSKHTPQSLSNSAVIFSLLLGGVVVSLSNSALNPAIPLFMQVFGVPLVSASWVLNAYVIAMAIGLIMVSYLATIFARKTLYLTALAVFGLGSMMGYFSPSIDWVIGARFLQGLAGGILIPLSVGILYQIVPHQRQGQTMGLWGMVVMLGLAVGPLVVKLAPAGILPCCSSPRSAIGNSKVLYG